MSVSADEGTRSILLLSASCILGWIEGCRDREWEYVTNPKSGVIVQTSVMCTQPSVLWAQEMPFLEVAFLKEVALPSP